MPERTRYLSWVPERLWPEDWGLLPGGSRRLGGSKRGADSTMTPLARSTSSTSNVGSDSWTGAFPADSFVLNALGAVYVHLSVRNRDSSGP
jgi:hypothetical protein